MKDPFQTQATPYEVLGVDRSAGPADIDRAFKAGLAKRVNPSKLTGAKKALERPVDRALLDLFQYDPEVLARLRPDPRADPGCLTLGARAATADAWEAQLRRSFPDYGIAHSLAVLWYWWALDASERVAAGGSAGADGSPSFDALWEGAIAYWAMVLASDDYWSKQTAVPGQAVPEVRRVLAERLPGDLQRLAQRHRDAAQEGLADQYRRLELVLATEVKTAKALAGAGYGTSAGPLWCGALMLGRLALLDSIREQVSADLASNPRDETLQSLTRALSPHFRIAALIERKEPQAALDAIEALPAGAKRASEVKELKARALLLKGRQEESLGRTRDALKLWKEAAGCVSSGALAGEIREAASEAALGAATALQSRDRKEAIAILEVAVSFAGTEKLNRTLAELLTDRGIETVVKAQKEFEKDPSAEGAAKLTEAIEKGLKDLERGAELGSARAKEQAEVARSLLGQITGGMSPGVRSLLEEANQAAGREDLDTSIRKLRSALGMLSAGSEAHTQVSKMLSAALSGHAVATVNRTMEQAQLIGPSEIATRLQDALRELTEAMGLDAGNEHAQNNAKSLLEMMVKLGVPLSAGLAPFELGSVATSARKETRGGLHATLAGVAVLAALFLSFSFISADLFGVTLRVTVWVWASAQTSALGSVVALLGYGIGMLAFLILISNVASPKALLGSFVELCVRKNQGALDYVVEGTLYVFLLLFALNAIVYRPPPNPVELPPDEMPATVEGVTPGQPGAAAAVPTGVDSASAAPAAESTATQVPTSTEATPEEPPTPEAATPEATPFDLSDVSWMATEPVPLGTVTGLLGAVTGLPEEEREPALARLDSAAAGAGETARATLTLLRSAVAEERGDLGTARAGYHQLLTIAGEGPYGATASLRLETLDARDEDALEDALKARVDQPGDTLWARTRGGWVQAPAQRAALLGLMDLRADRLPVRFYRFLAAHSFTAPHAAYLRIYGYVLILWLLVQLPLLNRMVSLFQVAPRLRPQVARLQELHKGDQATLAKKLSELYSQYGVNPAWGCLNGVIDIVFVVLFYFTFRGYAPQIVLDGANFFGMADLLHRDLRALGLWGFVGFLHTTTQPNITGPTTGVVMARAVFGVLFVCALAWFLHWPSWLLIFWSLLWLGSIFYRALAVLLEKKRA